MDFNSRIILPIVALEMFEIWAEAGCRFDNVVLAGENRLFFILQFTSNLVVLNE
jgi:hypothetical protein